MQQPQFNSRHRSKRLRIVLWLGVVRDPTRALEQLEVHHPVDLVTSREVNDDLGGGDPTRALEQLEVHHPVDLVTSCDVEPTVAPWM